MGFKRSERISLKLHPELNEKWGPRTHRIRPIDLETYEKFPPMQAPASYNLSRGDGGDPCARADAFDPRGWRRRLRSPREPDCNETGGPQGFPALQDKTFSREFDNRKGEIIVTASRSDGLSRRLVLGALAAIAGPARTSRRRHRAGSERCAARHPGTTARRSRRSSISSARPPTRRARISCRRKSASQTFDQDGTLWVEHPLYTQVVFCLDRVPALVKAKPELKGREPFKAVLTGDREAIAKLSMRELFEIVLETQSGMTVEDFRADVRQWLATAKHPRWNRPYTDLAYQPMIEVLALPARQRLHELHRHRRQRRNSCANIRAGSTTSRPSASCGTAQAAKFGYAKDGKPILTQEPKLVLDNLKAGKIENFWLLYGRRPQLAFGNSSSDDQQMLEYVKAGPACGFPPPCCTTTPSANTLTVRRRACRTRASGRSARRCTTWPSNRAGPSSV